MAYFYLSISDKRKTVFIYIKTRIWPSNPGQVPKKLKYVPVLVFGARTFHQPSKETCVNLKKGGLGTL
jgi:hypothetical protein